MTFVAKAAHITTMASVSSISLFLLTLKLIQPGEMPITLYNWVMCKPVFKVFFSKHALKETRTKCGPLLGSRSWAWNTFAMLLAQHPT